MTETLQNLIDRIQQDGVAKAETQAKAIEDTARRQAAEIIAGAEAQARAIVERAEREAALSVERSTRAIGQAARDVVISVHRAVTVLLEETLGGEVAAAMGSEAVARLVEHAVTAYASGGRERLDVLLEPEQQQAVLNLVRARLADALRQGVQIRADPAVVSGFRAVLVDRHVEHDFTGEAVTRALSQILRPHQADVLRRGLDALAAAQPTTQA
jgi:V/A-type H+/Na+-transporting ATPase subunit E